MAGRFSVSAIFKAVDKITAPVSKMQKRVQKFSRSMNRGLFKVNRSLSKIASSAKTAGLALAAMGFVAARALGNIIGVGADFEQTIVNAAAKLPGEIRKGSEEFALLEKAARKAGATTEFTASQAASGLEFLALAGFNAQQAVASLPGVIDLATAAQIDLARASDIATDTLGAFGLATKDSAQLTLNLARVSDVMAKTTTSANTNMEDLFETIKKGGAVAKSSGASIETFAALAGTMANSGLKASEAGSTLKNMFLRLAAPAPAASKLLKQFGIVTQDANGDLLDIVDILGSLEKNLGDLGTAEKAAVLDTIFGKRAITGVNILLEAGSDRLREYRGELEGATGTVGKMSNVMRDTLLGRLKNLNSAIESVKISIFDLNNKGLSDTVDKMTAWVRANEKLIATNVGDFIKSILDNLPTIVLWIERIAKGLAGFILFSAAVKVATVTMAAFNLVMALNPIGLMVLGVAALIAGFTALIVWIDDIAEAFNNMHPALRLVLAPLELIVRTIKAIKDLGALAGGVIGEFLFNAFGDNGGDEATQTEGATGPQVVTPQDRVARSVSEQQTTSTAEVTIKDETGRAEVTSGKLGNGLKLQDSGGF